MARLSDAALALKMGALVGLKNAGTLIARTYLEWTEDHASQYGAAMAYYMFFSLAPLLILAVAFAGTFFGAEAAEGKIVAELQYFIGRDGAAAIQALVWWARGSNAGLSVSIAGIGALLLGATQVFNSLQTALNRMWRVPDAAAARRGFKGDLLDLAKKRALSFAMVLVVGMLLVLSLLASAGLSAFGSYLSRLGRDSAEVAVLSFSEIALSLLLLTCLLAAIYKILPDARIAWGDVWFGAIVTSSLLTLGKLILGWYLAGSGITSVYGAAGSLVLILVWVYYSCQILLFGAEMTKVYASEFGSRRRRKSASLAG
ncbi:MAG TPA: YihY/virulence factor BrkB family protein [Vicinamibacteria bacterium]|nr:YihY/virulence factor BrkB family protein [Vicinamibacteria bacterium]